MNANQSPWARIARACRIIRNQPRAPWARHWSRWADMPGFTKAEHRAIRKVQAARLAREATR